MAQQERIVELIGRAKQGDRAAFDAVVSLCRGKLESFIRRRVRPELRQMLNIETLAHDTFTRTYESLERFRGEDEDAWRAWLAGIAKNVVLKALERFNRHQALELRREVAADGTSPSRAMRREERFERLESALRDLSEDHRRVILLCRVEGLRIKEAAEQLNRSPAATKMLLWRALQDLKGKFGDTESLSLPDRRLDPERGGHGG